VTGDPLMWPLLVGMVFVELVLAVFELLSAAVRALADAHSQ
jgi:hypothetical protein